MKTRLTVEESARLIKLGIDPKLASRETFIFDKIFTLDDILSIIPKSYFSEENYSTMNLCIEVLNDKWFVNYRCYCGGELAAQDVEREAPELIDSLYQLLIWAIEHNLIKTNKDN